MPSSVLIIATKGGASHNSFKVLTRESSIEARPLVSALFVCWVTIVPIRQLRRDRQGVRSSFAGFFNILLTCARHKSI